MEKYHKPVLLKESIEYLKVTKGEKYIDATVGGGGHAEAVLKFGGIILGIDVDPEAIEAAREYLSQACPSSIKNRGLIVPWRLAQDNFAHLKEIALEEKFIPVAGVLFDLGVSSHQLKTPGRGFSFNAEEPLDMRMDPSLSVTAADLVNGLNKGELNELFYKLGQEHFAGRVAEAICRARRVRPIKTCDQLAKIILASRPARSRFGQTHPATRCFQALRIAVNDELNNLKLALPQAVEILKPRGRLVIISFHSGEDRIVKQFFKEEGGRIKILTKKPILPSDEEVQANPRSRSAKLRAVEKLT